jgi:GTP:adenosylcobinamide-phosphate guanylyltransferase
MSELSYGGGLFELLKTEKDNYIKDVIVYITSLVQPLLQVHYHLLAKMNELTHLCKLLSTICHQCPENN